ncbi:tRNA-splicing endonuclease subunit sen54 [Leucoagaricus gongylophorus]
MLNLACRPAAARPVIPKRGEKEFEPRARGGTNLQAHVLERSRAAMFDTLLTTRTISSKGISYGIWHPLLERVEVTVSRGIHFNSMGHSVVRSTLDENGLEKVKKRLELLPEEAIYLIERGALFCWKKSDAHTAHLQGFEGIVGTPMSVQQAYAEMIGKENLTLERFQACFLTIKAKSIFSSFSQVFYNIFKPSTPFKKTTPPLPDFQVVVVNARTTPVPTLHELSTLFDNLPELPPPLPRPKRQAYGGKLMKTTTTEPSSHPPNALTSAAQPKLSFLWRLFSMFFASPSEPQRKSHPFAILKQGKKTIVVAAVDNGNISYFRFSQGAFEEWPMA